MGSERTIIFFTGSLEAGGIERFVTRVSLKAKQEHHFKPVVICLRKKIGIFVEELEREGVLVEEAPALWERNIISTVRLGKLIQSHDPYIVHSQVNFSLIQQLFAVRMFTNAGFFVTERNCYSLTGISKLKRRLQFSALKFFKAKYSANSNKVAQHLAEQVGQPISSIPVVPNGVDVTTTPIILRNSIRAKYGWTDTDFVIAYVARFAEHKGQGLFLESMRALQGKVDGRLKICFVGDGPTQGRIRKLAFEYKIESITKFLGIINNVNELYSASDAAALLSDFEGMPNSVIEAMASGLPVVANPVGNVEELFQDGAGIVNRETEPEKIAAHFLSLVVDDKLRHTVGEKARHVIREKVSLENTLSILKRNYGI
jgi:glycosyltransferase involved in cell wall biosynthesis